MDPLHRQAAFALLLKSRADDAALCRLVEAHLHAQAEAADDYKDAVLRAAHNLRMNPALAHEVVDAPDEVLARGTALDEIAEQQRMREERFRQMLEEKYEALNDETFQAIVRCRRCNSMEISWEEKQTRSADEGATLFCVCTACGNRWVMR